MCQVVVVAWFVAGFAPGLVYKVVVVAGMTSVISLKLSDSAILQFGYTLETLKKV